MSVAVRSGPLRFPVQITRAVETRTPSGSVSRDWAILAYWRCSIEPVTLRMQERFRGGELQQEVTHVVRMRYYHGLKAKDRISWNDNGTDRTLEIASIADLMERNRMQELLCREVA